MITDEDNVDSLKKILKRLPVQIERESTIFSIGARGHFENPTTEVLAFFCDVAGEHGLGDLVLSSLFEVLELNSDSLELKSKPEREVRTHSHKRIDLLLEGDYWVLALENKIGHIPNNPFDDYEHYVLVEQSVRFKDKKAIFILLSPDGESPEGYIKWKGISYEQLLNALKPKLADYFMANPFNKWAVMLREFVLHLEEMLVEPKLLRENMEFVFENYQAIQQAAKIKTEVFEQCNQVLNEHLTYVFDSEVSSSVVRWDNSNDAWRFALSKWCSKNSSNKSDIAVFMDQSIASGVGVNLYILIEEDAQQAIVDAIIEPVGCVRKWYEDDYACYRFESYSNLTMDTMKHEIEAKVRLLDEIETELRP
ncbi:PD-(D/E)XK nuclease family protein [Vibrio parahaemolyticus]|uniref:PD-(D/E)XK nuclease family protein n=1 Tax=Vibrio parahaemolyticus TaxID=670 RepID=UPI00226B568E|nr:PD-(D/E)XK nuclease family protein [Vibrio parahaemolyticus]MCX8840463.1 PD-(D/E)XK nuclease family protein [Vibrio parahaemolyticus]